MVGFNPMCTLETSFLPLEAKAGYADSQQLKKILFIGATRRRQRNRLGLQPDFWLKPTQVCRIQEA
jgi:hypothetical protein